MKKLNAAFIPLIFLIFIIFATACSTDPEAPSVLQLVSSSGQNYVSENRNVAGGTRVITGVYAQAPTDNVSLTNFKVTYSYDTTAKPNPINEVTYLDSLLVPDTKTFTMPVVYTPRNLDNMEVWKFIITDSNNKTYVRVVRIKTTSSVNKADSRYYTYSDVLLNRVKYHNNSSIDSLGLFGFALSNGMSFPANAVKQPRTMPLIDLIFNNTGTEKPSLSIMGSNSLVLTTLTPADFDSYTSITSLNNAYPTNAPEVKNQENLKKDQVLAFRSISNKVGLLKIDSVYKTLDSLVFDIKVEK